MRDGAAKQDAPRVGAEETSGSGLEAPIGKARRQPRVLGPESCLNAVSGHAIVAEPKRKKNVDENVGHARFADQRHFRGRFCGGEGVMEIPKRMRERAKEIADR